MGLLRDRFSFDLFGQPYRAELRAASETWVYSVFCGDELIHQEKRTPQYTEYYQPHTVEVPIEDTVVEFTFGPIGVFRFGLVVTQNAEILWRSSNRAFRTPPTAQRFLAWVQRQEERAAKPKTETQLAMEESARELRPAIIVDVAFGVVFFFVAREFGIVTAAVSGAAATLVLVVVDRFVKADLTGGFAVFGAVMALISAGLAILLLDDLAVKLRGSLMGCIIGLLALIDALRGGRYLGARFARYFYALGKLNPQRASFALAAASVLIVMIDTPLAFILTTDQWIWYNSFFDTLVSAPIMFGAMWFAKDRSDVSK